MPGSTETPNPISKLRSLLFAASVRPDLVAKMPRTGTDGIVIDNEDATPADKKSAGRIQAMGLAANFNIDKTMTAQVFVRVNAVASEWFEDDVRVGLHPSLAGVVVPKVETLEHMEAIGAALAAAGLQRLGVFVGLETALGVADARQLLAHPLAIAGYFGAEDFVVDMGGARTTSNNEVAYARSHVALAGRLAGIPVLDQIVADFTDDKRFARETAEARAMGYRGKLCIHPKQVAIANKIMGTLWPVLPPSEYKTCYISVVP
jgi:citrate lyase subunit beta/citryl-CoA lyase